MAKVIKLTSEGGEIQYSFHCPGCGYGHSYRTKKSLNDTRENVGVWEFNGDINNPTFSPSLLVNDFHPPSRCHLYVENGKIRFLNDCHHKLAGQTLEMKNERRS